uniref:Uncharacterized protein n=1 Tax=Hordeum vulgare subsp. vulgare TaxID=112509 RepID=A0A8I6YFI5_HORVV
MHKGDEEWLDNQPNNIPVRDFVDLPRGDNQYHKDVESLSNQIDHGDNDRDMIAIKMWEDYVIYRQQ